MVNVVLVDQWNLGKADEQVFRNRTDQTFGAVTNFDVFKDLHVVGLPARKEGFDLIGKGGEFGVLEYRRFDVIRSHLELQIARAVAGCK